MEKTSVDAMYQAVTHQHDQVAAKAVQAVKLQNAKISAKAVKKRGTVNAKGAKRVVKKSTEIALPATSSKPSSSRRTAKRGRNCAEKTNEVTESGDEEDRNEHEEEEAKDDSDYVADKVEEPVNETNSQIVLHSSQAEANNLIARPNKMKKSKKIKNQSEQDEETDSFQCQGSIKFVKRAFEQLARVSSWLDSVTAAGFGAFRNSDINSSMNKNCMSFCMLKLDPCTMRMSFGQNKVIEINRYNIHKLTGLPNGDRTAPRPSTGGDRKRMAALKVELGIVEGSGNAILIADLLLKLEKLADDELKNSDPGRKDEALKVFYLIFFNKIITTGVAPRLMREPKMVEGLVFSSMIDMDYSQLVVDEIQRSAENWQTSIRNKWSYLEAFSLGPLLMYLDSLICDDLTDMTLRAPRLEYLKEANLEKIANADSINNEDGIVFGKIIVSTTFFF